MLVSAMAVAVFVCLYHSIIVVVVLSHAVSLPLIVLALPFLIKLFTALLLLEEPFAVALFALTVMRVFFWDDGSCL
jgi:hypothetical protein